jgi:glycosyltransferase involved in cell wall biosynthesis
MISTRILHLIHSMDPKDGGPPEVVRQLALAAKEIGGTVEIACQDDKSSPFLHSLPCPVHAIGPSHSKYGYSRRLANWLKQNIARFDGLVIHGIWQYVDIAGARAAFKRIPYVVFVHGALDPWFKQQYPLKHIKKSLYWPFQYKVLQRASAVLFTGESERDQAVTSFWPNRWNGSIVPLGIQMPAGSRLDQADAFLSLFPKLRGRRYLLFLGRIHEKKGCDLLVTAFTRLAAQYPDVDLVIAGPDQVGLKAKLQAIAESAGITDRIHWPGMISGDAKYGAYAACDAFILPSHQENFGISVIEALACGKPVLITDKVEIWREIDQELVGLVEKDSLTGTEQLLRRWLSMSEMERMAMTARAIPGFEKHFSIQNAIHAIHRIFDKNLPLSA